LGRERAKGSGRKGKGKERKGEMEQRVGERGSPKYFTGTTSPVYMGFLGENIRYHRFLS